MDVNKYIPTKAQIDALDEMNSVRAEIEHILNRVIVMNESHRSREKSIIITKLEEANHRVVDDIANNHQLPSQKERKSNTVPMFPVQAMTLSFIGWAENNIYISVKEGATYRYPNLDYKTFLKFRFANDLDDWAQSELNHNTRELI